MSPAAFRYRVLILLGLAVGAGAAMFFVPPQPQPLWYHQFADQRCFCGIPHTLNVLSNLPFVIVGVWGVIYLIRCPRPDACRKSFERWAYVFFFAGLALTGIGSAYYHAEPNNDRLLWDRLPLAVAFMTLFAIVIGEFIDEGAGRCLLAPLVLLGGGSVIYWHWTETVGAGDMRLYLFVQLFPVAALPFILLLFPSSYTRASDLGGMLAWYVAAKGLELLDAVVYTQGGIVSGHTLKHLAAGFGAYLVLYMLRHRRPVAPGRLP